MKFGPVTKPTETQPPKASNLLNQSLKKLSSGDGTDEKSEKKPIVLSSTKTNVSSALATLANYAPDESDEPENNSLVTISGMTKRAYDDEILPNAPERIFPNPLDTAQQSFVDLLNSMYKIFDDGEMFVRAVQRIMQEIGTTPHLIEMMAPADSNVMMRGIRAAAGMAQVKKVEAKTKRAGGSKLAQEASALLGLVDLSKFVGGD